MLTVQTFHPAFLGWQSHDISFEAESFLCDGFRAYIRSQRTTTLKETS